MSTRPNQQTQTFQMRVNAKFLKLLDDWRRQQPDLPSRAEAIRRLVAIATAKRAERNKGESQA